MTNRLLVSPDPDMGTKPEVTKPKLDHEAEAKAFAFRNHEAEALPFLNHEAEAKSKATLYLLKYMANCAGQNGLKVKIVDIFSF